MLAYKRPIYFIPTVLTGPEIEKLADFVRNSIHFHPYHLHQGRTVDRSYVPSAEYAFVNKTGSSFLSSTHVPSNLYLFKIILELYDKQLGSGLFISLSNSILFVYTSGLTVERILQHFRCSVVKLNLAFYPITFNRSKKKINDISRIYKNAKLDRSSVVSLCQKVVMMYLRGTQQMLGVPKKNSFPV